MNNKLNNMIQRFLSNTDAKDEDELNENYRNFWKSIIMVKLSMKIQN